MKIYEYDGAGNDFVILPDLEETLPEEELPALAIRLCALRQVDGLMVLRKPLQGADCRMLFYNNDGSKAEMCGNGARCLCRFCCEEGLSGEMQRIETPAGLVIGERLSEELYRIALNPPTVFEERAGCSYLELGSPGIPHAILPGDLSQNRDKLKELAQSYRHHPLFPKGANVNLYELTGENSLKLLTYERGVEDFTLACGTGTGATVAALTAQGKVSGCHTEVVCPGGTLYVDIQGPQIFLTGPAKERWRGEVQPLDKVPGAAQVVAALIWQGEKFLICQRPPHKARGLLWEFVGGKVEPGESREEALRRECREELAVELSVGEVFMEVCHEYPDLLVHLSLFHAQISQGEPQKLEHVDIRWISPDEIPRYDFCPADEEILKKIIALKCG